MSHCIPRITSRFWLHSFVQVASLPGERALALKMTIDNEVPCIRAILDASELYLSFCADSLATFQVFFFCDSMR